MEEQQTSLKDEIRRLGQIIEQDKEKKQKKFRMPFGARVGKVKAKQNYASICYINENREVKFMKAPIKEGTIILDNCPHLATTDYLLSYKGKPFIIVPAWSTKPFSPEENYDEATKAKTTTVGYRLLLNTMKSEIVSAKKKVNATMIFILLVVIAAGAYFVFQGGLI